jgi:hypothetical protein
MFQALVFCHSIFRWLVLLALMISVYRAYTGYARRRPFNKIDNLLRHWTATIAHIQLLIGMWLYIKSPLVAYFWKHSSESTQHPEILFFGCIHIVLMLTAIVLVTIGSSLAKRRNTDHEKFRTMLLWFSVALLIILIAVPWPFSPLAARPYIR